MRSIDELLEAIKKGDAAEKGEAIYELGYRGADTKRTIPILVEILSCGDWGELASDALQTIGNDALLPTLKFLSRVTRRGTDERRGCDC